MKYYVNKNEVFRTYSNMLEAFSTVTKEWRTISFRVTDVVIKERGLVEITEEEALKRISDMLLDGLDSNQLHRLITFFKDCREIEWTPARLDARGVLILGYPNYPDELLFEVLELLGDDDCYENEKKLPRRIDKMDILQIRTFLTLLSQRERFCDGVLGDAVEDGIILRLLLRIEVLRRSRV